MKRKFPPAEHPVIRTHPQTGKKCVNVCPTYCQGIKGMSDEEAAPLLRELYALTNTPEYTCRLKWEPGMVCLLAYYCVKGSFLRNRRGGQLLCFVLILAGSRAAAAADCRDQRSLQFHSIPGIGDHCNCRNPSHHACNCRDLRSLQLHAIAVISDPWNRLQTPCACMHHGPKKSARASRQPGAGEDWRNG